MFSSFNRKRSVIFMRLLCALLLLGPGILLRAAEPTVPDRWTPEQATRWSEQQPWLVGGNFLPSDAINQLEMWQADTFSPTEIDREFGWAEGIGMNTMRVFLHDLLWQQDAEGFAKRIDQFLAIAERHHIRPVFVLFDSCWDPQPKLGLQHPPIPGIHNSGWVQSPGREGLTDPAQRKRLEAYVSGVVGRFANDKRILAWDVWNEPDNTNIPAFQAVEPKNKVDLVGELLPEVFRWARAAHPSQPLTSGLWIGDWGPDAKRTKIATIQIEQSDILSFHNYGFAEDFERRIQELRPYGRPLLCTEYMARGAGSLFDTVLPIARREHVGVINWGLVAGKSQTYLPWDSWRHPYTIDTPTVWFHDIFHTDGTPYRAAEVEQFRQLTGKK